MKRLFIPLLILLFVSLGIDLYVFQGIVVLTEGSSAAIRDTIRSGYWIFSQGLVYTLVMAFYLFFPAKKHMWLLNKLFNIFLTVFVTQLIFCGVLLVEDVIRAGLAIVRLLQVPGAPYPARSLLASGIATAVAVIPFFAVVFGITRGKYHYTVHRETIRIKNLPAAFEGFTLAQISDIHSGSFDDRKHVERGVQMIRDQHPDLFVFTGDLVNNKAEEIVPWIDVFSRIKAPFGQFSILGNHDYGDYVRWETPAAKQANLARLKHHHKEMNFRLLLDEHVILKKGNDQIALLGIENWGKGFGERGKLDEAMKGIDPDAVKILLSHDPSHWDAQVKDNPVKIDLTLSGHTHGMQFGIEAWGIKWSPVKYRYPNWAGLAEKNGRYLYVNRGFGFLGFSGRVGIWPEITILTLSRAGSQEKP